MFSVGILIQYSNSSNVLKSHFQDFTILGPIR